jgi:adenylate kinase
MSEHNDRAAWLKGPNACCSVPPQEPKRVYRLVLLGAPGVGKGTQAGLLCQRLGACHLSTGDLFRAAKCLQEDERSPALEDALSCMRRGELIPDETVLAMVRERMRCLCCHGGILLDGFPRTVAQAQALERLLNGQKLPLSGVLNYELPLQEIVVRLSGQRTCPGCKAVFHTTHQPPQVEGICDHCGARLCQREDDRPESIRVRMQAYQDNTMPLIDFYQKRGLLISIPAVGSPDEICNGTVAAMDRKIWSEQPPKRSRQKTSTECQRTRRAHRVRGVFSKPGQQKQ